MYTYIYTIQYSYLISKKGPFNINMLSRNDSIHKYIRIKEQTQRKYDNITIIIYNEIKSHSESNSSNLTCGKYLLTTFTHGMPEWPL